jgi:hypothetical protein
MPNVTRYNARDCAVVVDGIYLSGLGENMISVAKDEALAENVVGAQGDIVRSEINNSIYTITIGVQITSPQLSYLLSLKNRTEPFPVWIINKKLGIRAGGELCNITEMPEFTLGSTAEDLEIAITAYDGDIITT